ncbi:MAG: TIGR02597 family protein [Verrucomicrobiota bacterium]
MNKLILTITAALLGLSSPLLQAQSVSTTPYGVMNFTIPGGSQGAPSTSALSLTLEPALPENMVGIMSGEISAVSADSISSSGAGWSDSALSQPESPFYLLITSGDATGRQLPITANTTDRLTLDNSGISLKNSGAAKVGDRFKIVPGFTLLSFFGDSNIITRNNDFNRADNVFLLIDGGWRLFYLNKSPREWREAGFGSNRNNQALSPNTGLIYNRRGTDDLVITLDGYVPTTDAKNVVTLSGLTFVGGSFPIDKTLASLGFEDMNGWKTNSDFSKADLLFIFYNNRWYPYYHNGSNWLEAGLGSNKDNDVIPAGTPYLVQKFSTTKTNSAFVTNTIPYVLD